MPKPYLDFDYLRYMKKRSWATAKHVEFHPDTIPYRHDANEYANAWNKINDESRGNYFYADNYKVKRVGVLRHFWEGVKGFFGFENHCEPARVDMTLKKFAYYGYVNSYDQSVVKLKLEDANFHNLVIRPRANDNSLKLQNDLIRYHQLHSSELEPSAALQLISKPDYLSSLTEHRNFSFGNTFSSINRADLAIALDPQNDHFITSLVNTLSNGRNHPATNLDSFVLRNSKLAVSYADHLIQDFKNTNSNTSWFSKIGNAVSYLTNNQKQPDFSGIELALTCDDDVEERHAAFFFSYYVAQKKFEAAHVLYLKCKNQGNVSFDGEAIKQLAAHYYEEGKDLRTTGIKLENKHDLNKAEGKFILSYKKTKTATDLAPDNVIYRMGLFKRDYQLACLKARAPITSPETKFKELSDAIATAHAALNYFEEQAAVERNKTSALSQAAFSLLFTNPNPLLAKMTKNIVKAKAELVMALYKRAELLESAFNKSEAKSQKNELAMLIVQDCNKALGLDPTHQEAEALRDEMNDWAYKQTNNVMGI